MRAFLLDSKKGHLKPAIALASDGDELRLSNHKTPQQARDDAAEVVESLGLPLEDKTE